MHKYKGQSGNKMHLIFQGLLWLTIACILTVPSLAVKAQDEKRVLLLNSYHQGLNWTDEQTKGITQTLLNSGIQVNLFTEYLDWKSYQGLEYSDRLRDLYHYKYGNNSLDLIMTTDDAALEFALKHLETVFEGVPLVFSGIFPDSVPELMGKRQNITGVYEDIDPAGTLKIATGINPQIRHVYYIHDNTESGLGSREAILKAVNKSGLNLTVTTTEGQSLVSIIKEVERLNKESVVLMGSYNTDLNGAVLPPENVVNRVSTASPVPVYHLYEFLFDQGTVGGSLLSGELQGITAGELAVRVLKGETADSIPFVDRKTTRTVFDYIQLQRFNIPLSMLPPDSTIINRPFSFIETYNSLVFYTLLVFILLVFLLLHLLHNISKRRTAEKILRGKNEELSTLYEEITASEEELRQQFEELQVQGENLRRSEDRLRRAQAIAQVGNWEIDLQMGTIWGSEGAMRLYGFPEDTKTMSLAQAQAVVDPKDRINMNLALEGLIEREEKYDVEFQITRINDGKKRIMQSAAVLEKDEKGRPYKVLGVIQDITELKRTELKLKENHESLTALYQELLSSEEELRAQYADIEAINERLSVSEERYKLAIEGSNDGIWDWDIKGDTLIVSDRCLEIGAFESTIITGFYQVLNELIHREDLLITIQSMQEHLEGKSAHYRCEHRIKTKEGEYKWVLVRGKASWDYHGKPVRMAGSLTDISDIRRHQELIHRMAYYDSLTGIANKVLFEDRFSIALSLARRNYTKIALILLDLDNFKKINDTVGHHAGDLLLKEVTNRLLSCIRDYDTLARMGGDEFLILMQDIDREDDVLFVVARLEEAFNKSFTIDSNVFYVTTSIGISIYPDDGEETVELLKNADTAMYKAKELGKNCYQFYNISMKYDILKKIETENRLREAIKNQEFVLHYQPQIESRTGRIRGFEALIRWLDPEKGLISPLDFIPIAEDTGLISPIGEWVLRQACQSGSRWQQLIPGGVIISVNISAAQLKQRDFVFLINSILNETGLKPEYLELEITESVLIYAIDPIIKMLQELRELGVRVSLDDFGTGYSSLNYIRSLPLTSLKIDKAFIEDIKEVTCKTSIAGSIISLAHKLKLEIIAEGVETMDQQAYLINHNCDYLQGYLFSRPVTEEKVADLLKEGQFNLSSGLE